jgi:sulfoxide reductase heme-binding subunit YedZ
MTTTPPAAAPLPIPLLQGLTAVAGLLPVLALLVRLQSEWLPADPVAVAAGVSGRWALLFAVAALALPVLRERLARHWLLRLKPVIGGLALCYALAHLLIVLGLEYRFAWTDIVRHAVGRPAMLAGVAAAILALPVIATANRAALRALGRDAWQDWQRLRYLAAALACWHALALPLGGDPSRLPLTALLASLVLLTLIAVRLRERRAALRQPPPASGATASRPLHFFRRRPPAPPPSARP